MTEKAVRLIEAQNTLTFVFPLATPKPEIRRIITETFSVKVKTVRTSIRNNKKYAHVELSKETPAIDVATKLGLI